MDVHKALEVFQRTGYPYYLLHRQVSAGHVLGCMQQAQSILRTVLHCLAVCNQAPIDTRKMSQVLTLPLLPDGLDESVARLVCANAPAEILAACETLLQTTRDVLVTEQYKTLRSAIPFGEAFQAAYPELKRDLQGVLLGCDQQDIRALKESFISLYHELSRGIAQVQTGVEYSSFNGLAEYEQDLTRLGFPALLPHLLAGDYAELHRQCLLFDRCLQEFLTGHAVELNSFSTVEDLEAFLGNMDRKSQV